MVLMHGHLWVMGGVLSGWPLENESSGCLWQIVSFIKPALPGSELHWSSSSGRFRLWGKLELLYTEVYLVIRALEMVGFFLARKPYICAMKWVCGEAIDRHHGP